MKALGSFLCAFLCLAAAHAQYPSFSREVIAAGGDFFTSPTGSLSWTLGETVAEIFENNAINLVLTQGFQQPDEIEKTIGVWETPASIVFANVYPNPANRSIALDLKYDENSQVRIEMVDMLGRVLHEDNLTLKKGQRTTYRIDISPLSPGMYMFRLSGSGKLLSSCKFQKVSD